MNNLLGIFYGSLVPLKIKLATVAGESAENIKVVAHEIKGSAYNIGAILLGDLAQELEFVARKQNSSEIETLISKIQIELDRVKQFIENSSPSNLR